MAVVKRRRAMIEKFGGKCQRCGYNKSIRALHFHHTDPTDKYNWPMSRGNAPIGEIEQHPERFIVLCANCHAEVHDEEDKQLFVFDTCQHCGKKFRSQAHRKSIGRGKYCSKKCTFEAWKLRSQTDEAIFKRIWKHVDKTDTCWNWNGGLFNGKYPNLAVRQANGKYTLRFVHRLIYQSYVGDIPKGKEIIRACHNDRCVCPDHLIIA